MQKVDYLIVGGGIAGTTAAETIRQNDPKNSIIIISDEPHRLYSRIMLSKPNFFLEKIPFDNVWLKTKDWYKKNNINLIAGKKAASLDPKKAIITLDNKDKIHYEKLLLAVGATPYKWQAEGAEKKGVFYIRTLEDAKKIISSIKKAKRAVCIGGGFSSFEMCDMLKLAGLEVTVVIREPFFWDPMLDKASGQMIEKALENNGIKIYRDSIVEKVIGKKNVDGVILNDGTTITCDMVIAGIGVSPSMEWIKDTGIEINRGILATEYLETNIKNIWTAGDCSEFNDVILDEHILLGNWVNSQMQGKIAGLNMAGKKTKFSMVSFYTTQGFGITIAYTGDIRSLDRKIITRGSPEKNSYARLIVDKNDELIGATFINRTQELQAVIKLIAKNVKISKIEKQLKDPNVDLNKIIQNPTPVNSLAPKKQKKIRIGWFTFSCSEDNTMVMLEIMNDHWQEWKKNFDFRNVHALKRKNKFDSFDISFIEGAIASKAHEEKLKEIRKRSKKVVAVGACAVTGLPASQRNYYNEKQKEDIQFLLARFAALPRVLKVSEVVKVDAEIPGCPMDPKNFLKVVDDLTEQLK